ncbi:hypothetical protein ASD99_19900 [Mesorhizobium sp. Root695]|jgi:hypothetical protein|uniref:hypothetical protein n=1 Tax=Mesorhizobium sp. Root102 TaxID=1736422 RepID=UPI00070EC96E|nr:hypothetical protein [Mesorhizobium sp. Root102]KQU98795.1 hypothetical protein ASD12_20610 [Mesorhizobium sp. Root102]KRB32968.1 hypothetical protein ASD99_19900 [Mesorhizobium sp. Root695]
MSRERWCLRISTRRVRQAFGALGAAIFLGERTSPAGALGAAIILGAILSVAMSNRTPRVRTPSLAGPIPFDAALAHAAVPAAWARDNPVLNSGPLEKRGDTCR